MAIYQPVILVKFYIQGELRKKNSKYINFITEEENYY